MSSAPPTQPDARCPVCGTPVPPTAPRCERCNTPHHPECWTYAGGCAIFGCQQESPTFFASEHAWLEVAGWFEEWCSWHLLGTRALIAAPIAWWLTLAACIASYALPYAEPLQSITLACLLVAAVSLIALFLSLAVAKHVEASLDRATARLSAAAHPPRGIITTVAHRTGAGHIVDRALLILGILAALLAWPVAMGTTFPPTATAADRAGVITVIALVMTALWALPPLAARYFHKGRSLTYATVRNRVEATATLRKGSPSGTDDGC